MKGHIRQRGKDTWAVKIYTGRDPVTGKKKDRWFTVHGTKRDAQIEAAKKIAEFNGEGFVDPGKITVAEHLRSWLADHSTNIAGKTAERYREIVERHLIPALGNLPLAKLAPVHIQNYYAQALASGRLPNAGGKVRAKGDNSEPNAGEGAPSKAERGLSPSTVKYHHRVLSQALRAAWRLQLLRANPCAAVESPRATHKEMKTLSEAETGTLLKAIEATGLYVPVLLAVTTGMRRGEILALRWRNVDLDRAMLSVVETLEETRDKGLAIKPPKTARSRRTIKLPALAVEALRRHKAEQAKAALASGLRAVFEKSDLVCPSPLGEPRRPRDVTKAFARAVGKLGLNVRFHDLRHTHISHLLAAGVHPKVASERAGHASVAITLDVYSHVIPGMQEDAANRIDAALRAHLEK